MLTEQNNEMVLVREERTRNKFVQDSLSIHIFRPRCHWALRSRAVFINPFLSDRKVNTSAHANQTNKCVGKNTWKGHKPECKTAIVLCLEQSDALWNLSPVHAQHDLMTETAMLCTVLQRLGVSGISQSLAYRVPPNQLWLQGYLAKTSNNCVSQQCLRAFHKNGEGHTFYPARNDL